MFSLELKKKKKKKIEEKKSVSLLIFEARMNFLFYSSRRGSTLEFAPGILLKHPSTPLDPCFLEGNQLYWYFFFCSSSFLSVSTSRFLLCAGKRTSVSVSCPPRVTSLSWLWEKRQTDSHRGLCRLYHGSDSSEKKIYFRLLKIQPVQD